MLITNQWLDKLAAARNNFIAHGMLPPEHGPPPGFDNEGDDGGPTDGDRVLVDVRLALRTAGTLTNPKLIFID